MSETERQNKQKEIELKAAELEKQEKQEDEKAAKLAVELAKKAEEEEKAKAAAQLAERAKTLTAGVYIVGRDIDPGLYDENAISGKGNFFVDGSKWVNEMFGVGGGYYNDSFKNIKLGEGDTIEINNDLKIQFTPK